MAAILLIWQRDHMFSLWPTSSNLYILKVHASEQILLRYTVYECVWFKNDFQENHNEISN